MSATTPRPHFTAHSKGVRHGSAVGPSLQLFRSIVIGAVVAAGLSLVSAAPTVSAPANVGRSRHELRDADALLVHLAGLARLLPALALLVMRRCDR
jgi:hypothetical protein